MNALLLAGVISFVLSCCLGFLVIPLLKRLKAGQPILKYVEIHSDKSGTPTMGGLFFVLSAVIVFMIFGGYKGRLATVAISIGLAFMIVGFLDDYIKIKFKKNQGLKAYQKVFFQTGIAVVAGFFSYVNGITVFYIPFSMKTIDLGLWTIPVVALIFVAITNSVNLTDGIDGLAGSVSVIYLIITCSLIYVQMQNFSYLYPSKTEINTLYLLSSCLVGSILGFLVFNVPKAYVFMGDTGSLSLGGFLGAISIFSLNSFFIPIIGIMFVLSSISVIVQVLNFKRTGKRIFLMAPLHHHFQLKGHSESRIDFIYCICTAIVGALTVMSSL